jgi:hypothetical protein
MTRSTSLSKTLVSASCASPQPFFGQLSKMSSNQQKNVADHTERKGHKGWFIPGRLPHHLLSRSWNSSQLRSEPPDPKIEEANDTYTGANAANPGATEDGNKAVDLGNANDTWTIAEEKLRQDPEKCKVLKKYDGILADHFGLKLKEVGTLERRNQFLDLLNLEIPKLEKVESENRLGRCTRKAKRYFKSAVECVIASKDIIAAGASPCLPAAVACAGMVVVLSVSLSSRSASGC